MQPNRIAAIVAVLAGVLGAVAPLIADLDTSSVAGVIAGLVAIVAVVDRFLKGSQQWDALQAQTAAAVGPVIDQADEIGLLDDLEVEDIATEELPSDEEEFAAPPPDDPDPPDPLEQPR